MKKHLQKNRNLFGLWLMAMVCVFGNHSNAQSKQVIGTFPNMNGGFEGFATQTAINSNVSSTTQWWLQQTGGNTVNIMVGSSNARTGANYLRDVMTNTATRRVHSPVSTSNFPAGTYTVQYYFKGDLDGNPAGSSMTSAIYFGATIVGSTTSAATTTPTTDWTKFVTTLTLSGEDNTIYGVARPTNVLTVEFDDFVVYAGTEDNTAPEASTSFNASPASSQIGLSWVEPTGGVDGGGYMIIRYNSDPSGQPEPNVNGIYAVENTIGSGTVVYIGTGTSFTDTGLSTSTQYFYRIYAVDKAFNYSPALTGNVTTTSASYDSEPTSQVTGLNFTSVSTSEMTINWTPAVSGGGTNHLVVIGTSLSGDPVDGSSYTANTDFTSIGSSSVAGGKVVYNGTGNSVTVTGLTYNTTYSVRIYDFNGSDGTENYLTTSPASASQLTDRRTITSVASGAWTSTATWSDATVPTQDDNVVITSEKTVTIGKNNAGNCYNLNINAGGTLYSTAVSGEIGYVAVYGNSVVVDGSFADVTNDFTGIQFNQNCTISGSGSIRINRIRPLTTAVNATLTFNADVTLTNATGVTLMAESQTAGSNNIGYKVNSGRTVTSLGSLTGGSTSSGNASFGCTFTVDGTLNANNAIYLNAASGQSAALIVNGTLNIKTLNGSGGGSGAVPTINVNGSGVINVTGTGSSADFSNTATSGIVTGTGTFNLTSGATLLIGDVNGVNPTTGPIRCTTRNFADGSSYNFKGTSAQVTGVEMPSNIETLVINNAAGVSLNKQVNIGNTLTLTSGLLNLGAYNLQITSTNNINGGSATAYVVTNGAGKLYKSASAAQVVNLPVGASNVSYDPVVLTPTDATTFDVTVGTVLPGAAASGITYNEKVWNINSSAPSVTEMKLTPSSAVATNISDVIGHWNGSSYNNVQAIRSENSYTATVSTFSPFVTGTSDSPTSTIEPGSAVVIAVTNNKINVRGLQAGEIVALYGLNGQLAANFTSQGDDLTINISKGIYLLKLSTENNHIVHKIVVQ